MRFRGLPILLALAAAPVMAQEPMMNHTDPPSDLVPILDQFGNWLIQGAEQMPEADYGFTPIAGVRSFGQLIGHVANANFSICAAIMGATSPATMDYEKAPDKGAHVAALRESIAYCRTAHAWGKERHHDEVGFFGLKGSVTWALAFNITHMAEHYGNLVTYFRLKGMTPPSSQGQGG
ncbi:MAG: DinB family protein [Gemmatimonadales bacterium]|jgi:uncharacterized damage-inducible protein DinB|nr:DinB family protein [Gemmatimonadales bacterium]MDZ4257723.1 DinB family protein [Gemmatimonadales bacterium]MDZ4391022.1 DinB family protein [Gemmatimonadales bacterium]